MQVFESYQVKTIEDMKHVRNNDKSECFMKMS